MREKFEGFEALKAFGLVISQFFGLWFDIIFHDFSALDYYYFFVKTFVKMGFFTFIMNLSEFDSWILWLSITFPVKCFVSSYYINNFLSIFPVVHSLTPFSYAFKMWKIPLVVSFFIIPALSAKKYEESLLGTIKFFIPSGFGFVGLSCVLETIVFLIIQAVRVVSRVRRQPTAGGASFLDNEDIQQVVNYLQMTDNERQNVRI